MKTMDVNVTMASLSIWLCDDLYYIVRGFNSRLFDGSSKSI